MESAVEEVDVGVGVELEAALLLVTLGERRVYPICEGFVQI